MLADFVGFVDHSVADIARFKEVIARPIRDRFVGQNVFHLAHRHLPDSRTQMVMGTDVSSWSNRNLSDPQFVSVLQLREVAATDRRLVEDLCRNPLGIDLQRLGCVGLRYKSRRQEKYCQRTKLNIHGSSFVLWFNSHSRLFRLFWLRLSSAARV